MKVTIEIETAVGVASDEVLTASDCIDLCARAMVAAGFHPDSVNEAVQDMADEISNTKPEVVE